MNSDLTGSWSCLFCLIPGLLWLYRAENTFFRRQFLAWFLREMKAISLNHDRGLNLQSLTKFQLWLCAFCFILIASRQLSTEGSDFYISFCSVRWWLWIPTQFSWLLVSKCWCLIQNCDSASGFRFSFIRFSFPCVLLSRLNKKNMEVQLSCPQTWAVLLKCFISTSMIMKQLSSTLL